MEEFDYDVAFSFLAQDEELAGRINDHLKDRLRTFLYSEQQKVVAGTDGYDSFGAVFRERARVVVVLFRDGWGDARFTLIERDAIRHRAFESGWRFVVFIPLVKPPRVPEYVPPSYVWVGLERWGIDGACAAIEARVIEAGGTPAEADFEAAAARKRRELDLDQRRRDFRNSIDGLRWAAGEVDRMFAAMTEKATNSPVGMSASARQQVVTVRALGVIMDLVWEQPFSNTLDEAQLTLTFRDTSSKAKHGPRGETPTIGKPTAFVPDLGLTSDDRGWRGAGQWFTTDRLVDHFLRTMLDFVRE